MSKKILSIAIAITVAGFVAATNRSADAQLFPYTGTSTTPSSSVIMASSTATATTTSSASSTSASSTMSSNASVVPSASGYLQIDDLTVTGVSSSTAAPTQIFAADLSYPTIAEGSVMATTTPMVTCEQFITDSAPVGTPATCPVPTIAPAATTTATSSVYYSPYALEIDPTTQLLLSDRTPAVLGNITPGDIVNVYGYFNGGDGIIDAEVVRDLSKPAGALIATSGSSSSTALPVATSSVAVAELQTYIGQLQSLIVQLEGEISSGTVAVSSTTSAPMIPAVVY